MEEYPTTSEKEEGTREMKEERDEDRQEKVEERKEETERGKAGNRSQEQRSIISFPRYGFICSWNSTIERKSKT
jgi:hypothetical protein